MPGWHQTCRSGSGDGFLSINRDASSPGPLHKLRILLFQPRKVFFRLPRPDAVAGKDEIHLLECALVRFWVQCPDYENTEDVNATENVERFLAEAVEDGGE